MQISEHTWRKYAFFLLCTMIEFSRITICIELILLMNLREYAFTPVCDDVSLPACLYPKQILLWNYETLFCIASIFLKSKHFAQFCVKCPQVFSCVLTMWDALWKTSVNLFLADVFCYKIMFYKFSFDRVSFIHVTLF